MTAWIVNPFDNLPMEGHRPQRYWLMARAFADAGWDVVYWTSDFSHAKKRERRFEKFEKFEKCEKCERFEGIRVVMIPTLPYRKNVCLARIRSHLKLARDFKRLALEMGRSGVRPHGETPDLVVASTPPLGLCAAALEVARECGAKFVCDIQDAWPETFARLLPRGFKWMGAILFAGMRRTAKKIYREADLVTGVSARYAELAGRDDFYLAYHGIGNASGQTGAGSGRTRRPAPPKSLVYVGNLGAGYDLGSVVAAVAKRAELTLDIAGLGPREAELKELAGRLNVQDRVRFHGYLGAEEMEKLMATCDVGIIPMRDDSWVGLPYKLGDYLAAGLHVVSSLKGECGALLERTGFGATYERRSPESLLAALDRLGEGEVMLPEELRAEAIYPKYVKRVDMV